MRYAEKCITNLMRIWYVFIQYLCCYSHYFPYTFHPVNISVITFDCIVFILRLFSYLSSSSTANEGTFLCMQIFKKDRKLKPNCTAPAKLEHTRAIGKRFKQLSPWYSSTYIITHSVLCMPNWFPQMISQSKHWWHWFLFAVKMVWGWSVPSQVLG